MTLSTISNVINRVSSSCVLQTVPFYKTATVSIQAGYFFSYYSATTGFTSGPTWNSAATYPTVGKTATILSQSNSGSIPFQASASGSDQYLIGMSFTTQLATAVSAILVDRIAQCQLNLSETNGNFTGFSAVDRLGSTGSYDGGAQIWCEVSENFSNTTSLFYLTYTNQNGTGSRQTPIITARPSGTLGHTILPTSGAFIPLQGSDTGVRSIESFTFVSGSSIATGKFCIALVKPLAIVSEWGVLTQVEDYDFLQQIICPEKIHDDAFLNFIVWTGGTGAYPINGQLRMYSE